MFTFLRRLRARLKYRHFDRDLAREIEVHRAMKQDELDAGGVSAADTRSRVARSLGNVTYMREEARSVWIARWIQEAVQDSLHAGRLMRRQAAFSFASVVTLGLALGLMTSVFALYSALYFRPWPVPEPGKLFIVTAESSSGRLTSEGFSSNALDRLAAASASTDFVAHEETEFELAVPGRKDLVSLVGDWVSPGFLRVLKIPLQQGGGFDATTGAAEVIVSDRVWRTHLAGRSDVTGQVVQLGKTSATIVGVLPPNFPGLAPRHIDVMANMASRAAWQTGWRPDAGCCQIVGRVRPGYTMADAAAELAATGAVALSTNRNAVKQVRLTDTAMGSQPGGLRHTVPTVFQLLFAASVLVLILACANVGNLHLARGLRRQRELALRLSIGATRSRIVRQLLAESLAVTVLAAFAGLGVALVLPSFVLQFDRPDSFYALSPDFRTYAFVAAMTCLTCAMFGLAPALRVTRRDSCSGLTMVPQGAGRLRSIVLGTQVAVSAALVLAATLLVRGVVLTANTDGGFALKEVNVGHIVKPAAFDAKQNASLVFHLERELNVSQGRDFGLTEAPPLSARVVTVTSTGLPTARVMTMSASSFEVLGVPILAGRVYSDQPEGRELVVNAALADAAWPGQSALGQTFDGSTVVGIASNARVASIVQTLPIAFKPLRRSGGLFVTFRADKAAEARIRQAIAAFDPRLMLRVTPAAAEVRSQLDNSIIGATVAGGVGVLTLVLAMVGVFGVCAFIVEERRREIGIRLALGASSLDIRRGIVRAARWPLAGGLGSGLALAILAGSLLKSFLLEVSPIDPASYTLVLSLLLMAGAIATWFPMRRAARVDPAITLRHD